MAPVKIIFPIFLLCCVYIMTLAESQNVSSISRNNPMHARQKRFILLKKKILAAKLHHLGLGHGHGHDILKGHHHGHYGGPHLPPVSRHHGYYPTYHRYYPTHHGYYPEHHCSGKPVHRSHVHNEHHY